MDPSSSPWWVELLKAVPSIVAACTAVYGLGIAKAGLTKWRSETIGKRKAEIAEEVLADAYQFQDLIVAARNPSGWSNEGSTRVKAEWETEQDTTLLNSYYRTVERLQSQSEFFSKLYARRYRFIALFGFAAGKPFDELAYVRGHINQSVHQLIRTYPERDNDHVRQLRTRWETAIGWGLSGNDDTYDRLEKAIKALEGTCRPAIQEFER